MHVQRSEAKKKTDGQSHLGTHYILIRRNSLAILDINVFL